MGHCEGRWKLNQFFSSLTQLYESREAEGSKEKPPKWHLKPRGTSARSWCGWHCFHWAVLCEWELHTWRWPTVQRSPELWPSPSGLGVLTNLQASFYSPLHLERGKVRGTRRHPLNPVCAVAVMGWGRACGRWKVSRQRPAGKLLTTDLMQQWLWLWGQAACLEQGPAGFPHTTGQGQH